MGSRRTSGAWSHFHDMGEQATCSHCHKILQCKGGSTSGLKRHLSIIHSIDISQGGTEPPVQKRSRPTVPVKSIRKMTLAERLAQYAAVDGFSIHDISRSDQIQEHLRSKGFEVSKDPNTIMEMICGHYRNVEAETKRRISELKFSNSQFSINLAEYATVHKKRYININLHSNAEHFNLGLVRIKGSHTAEDCLESLQRMLADFGISLDEDVVGLTTDGSNVMQEIAGLSPAEHQRCYAQGLRLAVLDVIYTEKKYKAEASSKQEINDSEDDIEPYGDDNEREDDETQGRMELIPQFQQVIDKVRRIVKLFRKSPNENGLLKIYTKLQFGEEMSLFLDCKTRWDSLLLMLKRFIKLKSAGIQSLKDVDKSSEFLTKEEMDRIVALCSGLEPFKVGAEMICRSEATLLTAEKTLQFMVQELSKQPGSLAQDLKAALLERVAQRRNSVLVGLLQYLDDPGPCCMCRPQ